MNMFSQFYRYLIALEYTLFIRSIGIFFGGLLLIITGMLGYYYTTIHSLNGQITRTKRQQEEVRQLLGHFTQLQEEIQKVNTVLDEEKNFKNALEESLHENEITIFFDERNTAQEIELERKSIGFFIGPEGGFSEDEIHLAQEKNTTMIQLGKTTLRAETAAIVGTFNLKNKQTLLN